jgi:uncharacterized protein YdhG (YjbR/CyaY superfamily)
MPGQKKPAAGGRKPARTVAGYLASLPPESRRALERLRRDIRSAAPQAEELIAWDMPAFKQGRLLVGYAAFKGHASLFPMSLKVMSDFAAKLKPYGPGKGTVRFPFSAPLPAALVRRIVKARIAENEARRLPARARKMPRPLD